MFEIEEPKYLLLISTEDFYKNYHHYELINIGCLCCYMIIEWDTCAAHAVIK